MPEPVRTCLGCRRQVDQSTLLRIVASGGAVSLDRRRRQPGRGAYLHRDQGCVDQAVRRRAFGRALRSQVDAAAAGRVLTAFLDTPLTNP